MIVKVELKHVLDVMVALITMLLATSCNAQEQKQCIFTDPQRGDTVVNRQDFGVAFDLEDSNAPGHYWVAIASVAGHDKTWQRVLDLYNNLNGANPDPQARAEMLKLIGSWKLNQFWPKFYVPPRTRHCRVFDGGVNPLQGQEPQPMVLLILRVDDRLNEYFKKWFKNGAEGKGYPGIPVSRLGNDMIRARCEIFFP